MKNFFQKLGADIGTMKNLPITFVIFVLALLDPINKAIKLFKELPTIVVFGGIYFALVIIYIYINNTKVKLKNKKTEDRYTANEKKIAKYLFIPLSVLFAGYCTLWTVNLINDKKEEKQTKVLTQEEIDARNKKINILAAAFTRNKSDDHFCQQLLSELSGKLDSLRDLVVIDRDSSYYDDVSGTEEKIKKRFTSNGTAIRGIFAFGDYAPDEKSLVCHISVHNFADSVLLTIPGLSGSSSILRFEQNYEIDFGKKIESTADFIYALLLQKLGKYNESQNVISKYKPEDTTTMTQSMRLNFFELAGNNSLATKDFSKAIAYYNSAQDIEPANENLSYYRAVAYSSNNEFYTAKTILDKQTVKTEEHSNLTQVLAANINNPSIQKSGFSLDGTGTCQLVTNERVLSNLDYIDEITIKDKRYFIPGNKGVFTILDEKGNTVASVDGKPASEIIIGRLQEKNVLDQLKRIESMTGSVSK